MYIQLLITTLVVVTIVTTIVTTTKINFSTVLLRIPFIKKRVETFINKEKEKLYRKLLEHDQYSLVPVFNIIPDDSISGSEIVEWCDQLEAEENINVSNGGLSGGVYHNNKELLLLQKEVIGRTLCGNPLLADAQGRFLKMEAQVISMIGILYNAPSGATGTVTTGGTDSIIHACMAYRNRAVNNRRSSWTTLFKPKFNMVVASSVHAAFYKAGEILGIEVITVPVDPVTFKADPAAMEARINRNTIMIVGSTPSYPVGVIDPIEQLSVIAVRHNIPLHVDSCLGSMMLPFASSGALDFRNEGVMSVSVDTHKYGYCPKGSSVLLYRTEQLRHYQMFSHPNWDGGVYITPSIHGTRIGSAIAATWATLLKIGKDKYRRYTEEIIFTREQIQKRVTESVPELEVCGDPQLSIVAFRFRTGVNANIYSVVDHMKKRGYEVHAIQNPKCFHFCVTMIHVYSEQFIEDFVYCVKESVAASSASAASANTDTATLYGTVSKVPTQFIDQLGFYYWDVRSRT